jgi:hypothetical protein
MRVTGRSRCSQSALPRRFAWSTCRSACPRPRPAPAGEPGRCTRSERRSWLSTPTAPSAARRPRSQPEVGRLASRNRQGDLDRQAAWTIQRLLTDDGPARAGPGRLGARTWSIPAKAYWLSGPDNHHRQGAAGTSDHPEPSHGVEPATGDPATPVASPPGPASIQVAGNHWPRRNLHRPRHGRPFRFKQRLLAGTSEGGNATHEDHGRL